jgi:outer membrane lipoprotein SlyB
MSAQNNVSVAAATQKLRLHPLMALAAVCVIALSVTGVAAMTGLLKTSKADDAAPAALNAAPGAAKSGAVADKPAQPVQAARPRPAQVAAAPTYQAAPAVAQNVGVVENIQTVTTPGQATGVGAVAGGVLGGVVGNQIGGGNGKKVATVAGVVGGGLLGNHIEKQQRATTSYSVTVRMENGERRTVRLASANGYRVGDRVRVENGQLAAL